MEDFFLETIQGILSEKAADESAFFGGNARLFVTSFSRRRFEITKLKMSFQLNFTGSCQRGYAIVSR